MNMTTVETFACFQIHPKNELHGQEGTRATEVFKCVTKWADNRTRDPYLVWDCTTWVNHLRKWLTFARLARLRTRSSRALAARPSALVAPARQESGDNVRSGRRGRAGRVLRRVGVRERSANQRTKMNTRQHSFLSSANEASSTRPTYCVPSWVNVM
jgi:hypothetical protein